MRTIDSDDVSFEISSDWVSDWINENPNCMQELGRRVRVTTWWQPRYIGLGADPERAIALEIMPTVFQLAPDGKVPDQRAVAAMFSETYFGYADEDEYEEEKGRPQTEQLVMISPMRVIRIEEIDMDEGPDEDDEHYGGPDELSDEPWSWIVWAHDQWGNTSTFGLVPKIYERGSAATQEEARAAAESSARRAGWILPSGDPPIDIRHSQEVMDELSLEVEMEEFSEDPGEEN